MVCHDTTGNYKKIPTGCGKEEEGLDLLQIARSAGPPARANCGACHWCGGGGVGIKHGDLDDTLKDPSPSHDYHMGALDFSCQECHRTTAHKIAGTSTTSAVSEGGVSCVDCHEERPHEDSHPLLRILNNHGDAMACQTCHIPEFAKALPTLTFWDWSLAGKDTEVSETSGYCITMRQKKKGLLIKKKKIRPTYAWYNGKHRRYLKGDPADLTGTTYLNMPVGGIKDSGAKITPYKIVEGRQPADAGHGYLVIPRLWEGYWNHFDWNRAAEEGMRVAGLPYSGELIFVKTIMHWRLNHEIVPKEQALSCTDCHRPDGVMDFKALGYQGDPAITGGRTTINDLSRE